jgi:sugar/nucleoside kinase (ribokinase family)
MGSASLVCIGLTTVDVVALPVRPQIFDRVSLLKALQIQPAGTAAGAALVAARLGVRTQLLGAVGDDAVGRCVLGELEHAGIDVSLMQVVAGKPTSATLVAIDEAGSRMIHHAPGAAAGLELTGSARTAACAAAVIHYAGVGGPLLDGGSGADLLAAARAGGTMITCDLIAPGAGAAAELRRILPHVDVFLPSAVEARFVTGMEDLEAAGRMLREWGARACVIKNGAQGALAFDARGRFEAMAAIPVESVVDTTSCGDSFCAGFIAATLRGRAWREALHFAAATAALVAQGPATLGRLESFEQVDGLAPGGTRVSEARES